MASRRSDPPNLGSEYRRGEVKCTTGQSPFKCVFKTSMLEFSVFLPVVVHLAYCEYAGNCSPSLLTSGAPPSPGLPIFLVFFSSASAMNFPCGKKVSMIVV